jgi:alpha-L-rhamnosidase
MYEQYGDRRILEENYEGLKKYVDYLRSRAVDHIIRFSYYGDWVALEPTPGEVVSTAYYYWDAQTVAKAAQILGRSADAQTYSQLTGQIKDAFNRTFLNTTTGNYGPGTQTANAMPLFLDLVPETPGEHGRPPAKFFVQFNLTQDVLYKHDSHLTTGFIGAKYLFPTLTKMGRSDLAYDVATQTTFPGWGYMIANGATTLWELWQNKVGPSMNSHNHPMLGSIGAWFYQAIGGINVDPNGPGYRRILIQPQIVRDLTAASATVETVRGTVSCSWTHLPGEITVVVVVPVGSDTKVIIPRDPERTRVVVREGDRVVWEKGKYVSGVPGVTNASMGATDVSFLAPTAESVVIAVGSGHYIFKLTEE